MMRQSTRLIVNISVTYARMLLTVGIGLLVARLMVKTLGFVDFGLLTALGASGIFLTTFKSSLTRSSLRHLAYAIGQGDPKHLHSLFNTTLILFLSLSLAIWVAGQAFRPLLFKALTIPSDREQAVFWVFQFTLVQLMLSVALTPYRAALNAHQAMIFTAWTDIVGRIFDLIIIILLTLLPWDHLVTYSGLTLAFSILGVITPIWVCLKRYPETRPNLKLFHWSHVRELGSFAGWTMFGQIAWDMRNEGSILLLNAFFGPVVNGAYAIAMRVMAYQNQLAFAIMSAIQPAMTSLEGRGGREQVRKLVFLTCKYPVLVSLLMWTPMMIETEGILHLWLGDYPDGAPIFTRILTTTMLIGIISYGYHMAMESRGQIAAVTLWMSVPQLIVIVLVSVAYSLFVVPYWVLPTSVLIVVSLFSFFWRPWYVGRIVNLPAFDWVKYTLWPITLIVLAGGGSGLVIHFLLSAGMTRIITVTAVNALISLPLIWLIAMEPWEKHHFLRVSKSAFAKLGYTPL